MPVTAEQYHQSLRPEYSGTVLALVLSDMFTHEWMMWEPAVLKAEVTEMLDVNLDPSIVDKTQAIATLHTTNQFPLSLDVFHHVCKALAGQVLDADQYIPLYLDNVLIGCTEAGLHIGKLENVATEISKYVGVLLTQHGLYLPPSVLDFAEYEDVGEQTAGARQDEIADKTFWADQKEMQTILENTGLAHLRRIILEVKDTPVPVDNKELTRVEQAVQDLMSR